MTSSKLIPLIFLLIWILFPISVPSPAPSPAPSPYTTCAVDRLMFADCLPFLSTPPDNLTTVASKNCCDAISSLNFTTVSGDPCVSRLIRQRRINVTRIVLLQSTCMGIATRSPVMLWNCPSVNELGGGKPISKDEQVIQCYIEIKGGCADVGCCGEICKRKVRYAKIVNVSYKAPHLCYCHVIYRHKQGSSAP